MRYSPRFLRIRDFVLEENLLQAVKTAALRHIESGTWIYTTYVWHTTAFTPTNHIEDRLLAGVQSLIKLD